MTQIVTLETAKLAKECGFDEQCMGSYTHYVTERVHEEDGTSGPFGWKKDEVEFSADFFKNFEDMCDYSNENYKMYAAPTQTVLQRWLREKKGIIVYVVPFWISSSGGWAYNLQQWNNGKLLEQIEQEASSVHLSFEEALKEGLQKSLELLNKDTEQND